MTEPTTTSSCDYTAQTTHHAWSCTLEANHPGGHVLHALSCDLPAPCLLDPTRQLP